MRFTGFDDVRRFLEDRGTLFLGPGVEVYEGMIVGEHARDTDLVVNPCKRKHLTNMRSSSSDDSLRLKPHRLMGLDWTFLPTVAVAVALGAMAVTLAFGLAGTLAALRQRPLALLRNE